MTTARARPTPAPPPARLPGSLPGPAADPCLFLIAPASLAGWFSDFVEWRDDDDILHLGEDIETRTDLAGIRRALTVNGVCRTAVLLSSHDTLRRDRALADALLAAGHAVVSQSTRAVRLGSDKVAMKAFFDRHGFRTPPWRHPTGGTLPGTARPARVVVKRRNGTQSTGTRLADYPAIDPARDEFCELYQDGVEYSVVVHRHRGRTITFPPVWKGATSPRLVPPWRRLRLCPAPDLPAGRERILRRTSAALAEAADIDGHLEVEFLLSDPGEPYLLEINPRVSGTLRIVALASGLPVFSLHRGSYPEWVPATRYAAEVPYDGTPFRAPAGGAFATSRLTVTGVSPQQVRDRLLRHGADRTWVDGPLWTQDTIRISPGERG